MQNNEPVLETVKKYLVDNGADVGESFVNHAPNNAFIRFSFDNREYVIGMTNTARQILQHWKLEEIDDLLHFYRVLPGARDLHPGEFFLVRCAESVQQAQGTFMGRGIVVAAAAMSDFEIA